jgi:pSer/pThr/pTyr-binding forkhead associated (FHA) protein
MWILQTSAAGAEPLVFRLSAGTVKTIGRTSGADFVLDHALVSRGDEALEVHDLDSTNGTFVNGTRVTRAHVRHGDRLRLGRVELTVDHQG